MMFDAATLLAHPYHHGWFPWFPLIPLFFIALWVVVFLLIARRWRRVSSPRGRGEAVLAERYARGEIDESEYRARREVLRRTD